MMQRRLILFSAIAVAVALHMAVRSSSPLVVDIIVRAVDFVERAPFTLMFVIALLLVTAGAGAWATLQGIRAQAKRKRTGKRRRLRGRVHHHAATH